MKTLLKNQKLKTALVIMLAVILMVPVMFLMTACGQSNKVTIYNTKDMTDEQILEYFSESVLSDVKSDVRNRTIVIYEVGDDVAEGVEVKWNLKNEAGDIILTDEDLEGVYVDEDAPQIDTRIEKVMISWDEADLDQTWSIVFYYQDNAEDIQLAEATIDVTTAEFVK